MQLVRSILLHVDARSGSAVRLHLARELGLHHEALITALFAISSSYVARPYAFSEGPAAVLTVLKQFDTVQSVAARATFDRKPSPSALWRCTGPT